MGLPLLYTLCPAPSALSKTCPQTPHPPSNIIEQLPPYSLQFTEHPQTPHSFQNIMEQYPPYLPQTKEQTSDTITTKPTLRRNHDRRTLSARRETGSRGSRQNI